ncbi:MAG TPA: hypothetical protein VMI32_07095 [Candidatus Solibacter sp.]|nr:hypothetical protein [Candidatus Solibacter sp.]
MQTKEKLIAEGVAAGKIVYTFSEIVNGKPQYFCSLKKVPEATRYYFTTPLKAFEEKAADIRQKRTGKPEGF